MSTLVPNRERSTSAGDRSSDASEESGIRRKVKRRTESKDSKDLTLDDLLPLAPQEKPTRRARSKSAAAPRTRGRPSLLLSGGDGMGNIEAIAAQAVALERKLEKAATEDNKRSEGPSEEKPEEKRPDHSHHTHTADGHESRGLPRRSASSTSADGMRKKIKKKMGYAGTIPEDDAFGEPRIVEQESDEDDVGSSVDAGAGSMEETSQTLERASGSESGIKPSPSSQSSDVGEGQLLDLTAGRLCEGIGSVESTPRPSGADDVDMVKPLESPVVDVVRRASSHLPTLPSCTIPPLEPVIEEELSGEEEQVEKEEVPVPVSKPAEAGVPAAAEGQDQVADVPVVLGPDDSVPVGYVPPPRKELRIGYFEQLEFTRIEELRKQKESEMTKKKKGKLIIGGPSAHSHSGTKRRDSGLITPKLDRPAGPIRSSAVGGLECVMTHSVGVKSLAQFALRIHCEENVLFAQEVVKYKKARGKTRKTLKFGIFRSFVKRGAEKELNIPEALYQTVLKSIANQELDKKDDDGTIFDALLDAVLKNVEEDMFPKYLNSDEAWELAEKWKNTTLQAPEPLFSGSYAGFTSSITRYFVRPPDAMVQAASPQTPKSPSVGGIRTRLRRLSMGGSSSQNIPGVALLAQDVDSAAAAAALATAAATTTPAREAKRVSHMNELPDDVLTRIFTFLSSPLLYRSSRVARRWRAIINSEDGSLWKGVAHAEFSLCLRKPPKWFAPELGHDWRENFRKLMRSSKILLDCAGPQHSFLFSRDGMHLLGPMSGAKSPFEVTRVDPHQSVRFSYASVSSSHVLACTHDGVLYSWSWKPFEHLGHRTYHKDAFADIRRVYPLRNEYIVHASAGRAHSLAATDLGAVYSWGEMDHGQLGRRRDSGDLGGVRRIGSLEDYDCVMVAAGDKHSLALTDKREVFAWGTIPDRDGVGEQTVWGAKLFTPLRRVRVVQIAAGGRHSIALCKKGNVYTWGFNDSGQLGVKDCTQRCHCGDPIDVRRVTLVAAGHAHSAAATGSGWVYTWGRGKEGQLGHGDVNDSPFPRLVTGLQGHFIVAVSCGDTHTLAFSAAGSAFAWGTGEDGQLGLGKEKTSVRKPNRIAIPFFALSRAIL